MNTPLPPAVEEALRTHLRLPASTPLPVDEDGDVPVQWRRALLYVRSIGGDPPWVRVWTHIVRDVELVPDLRTLVNDINSQVAGARVFCGDHTLFASAELHEASITPGTLAATFWAVGSIVEWVEPRVIAAFGGTPGFDDPRAASWR